MGTVAVIGLRGVPDVMGGIETHCAQLLPKLLTKAPEGELRITVLARSGYVAEAGQHDGIDQVPIWAPRHRALETIVHTFVAVLYARFRLHADCVYLHGIGPGLMSPLARLLGLRILFTHHGEDYRRHKWGRFSKAMLRLGEVLSVVFAHRVITVSQATATALKARFPGRADRIVYTPNGVAPSEGRRERPGLLEELGLIPGDYVVCVGRIVPEKAQDLLIEAYRKSGLANRTPPCKLVIVGAADHQSAYADQIEACADGDVILAGRRSRSEVMTLNRNAALFVLPSFHEGLSIAALEAIRAGTPILLSDIQANRDIGLPKQHYFIAGSVDSLATRLDTDFTDCRVQDGFDIGAFDWDRIARATLEQLMAVQGIAGFSPATAPKH